jgi:hypothetical protein
MSHISLKLRGRAMDIAQTIANLAAQFPDPDDRADARGFVKRVRKRNGLNDKQKADCIRDALAKGCSTYQDLITVTHFHREKITALVKQMEADGIVKLTPMVPGEGGGRPYIFIELIDDKVL